MLFVLHAPWVTDAQRKAAGEFGRWLRAQLTPEFVARFGYRPGDPSRQPLPPVTRANGVDPSQLSQVGLAPNRPSPESVDTS